MIMSHEEMKAKAAKLGIYTLEDQKKREQERLAATSGHGANFSTNGHSSSNGHAQVTDQPPVIGLEDLQDETYQKSSSDLNLEFITSKQSFSIEDAYRHFIAAIKPYWYTIPGTEIQITCPLPDHPDRTPSASYNPTSQLWRCHACDLGGDARDIAAIGLGHELGSGTYKTGPGWGALLREIAERTGYYQEQKTLGNSNPGWVAFEPSVPATQPTYPAPLTLVTPINGTPDPKPDKVSKIPSADWSAIAKPDSFLDKYINITRDTQIPDEYNAFNGLVALGLALGSTTFFQDRSPVFGNLYSCTVGATGSGKSRAFRPLIDLLEKVLPYVPDDPGNYGVEHLESPASGEALLLGFQREIEDPVDPKKTTPYPVKGLVTFPEMEEMYAKMQRIGNTMSSNMIRMYDNNPKVSTISVGRGKQLVIGPFCSAIGTIQLDRVSKLLLDKDSRSGFTNRWVFPMGPEKEQELLDPSVSPDMTDTEDSFRSVYAWSQLHHRVYARRNSPAFNALYNIWTTKYEPLKKADKSAMLVRLDLLLKKFCLLLSANAHETELTVDTVNRVEILMDYVVKTFDIISGKVGLTDHKVMEDRVLRVIQSYEKNHNGEFPTITNLRKNLRHTKMEMGQLEKILKTISNLGLIDILPGGFGANGKPGRTAARYRYNTN